MSWQQALGLNLGLFVVGPLFALVVGPGSTGPFELVLGGVIGGAVGYALAGSLSAPDDGGA